MLQCHNPEMLQVFVNGYLLLISLGQGSVALYGALQGKSPLSLTPLDVSGQRLAASRIACGIDRPYFQDAVAVVGGELVALLALALVLSPAEQSHLQRQWREWDTMGRTPAPLLRYEYRPRDLGVGESQPG